jgi:hypothetical protein
MFWMAKWIMNEKIGISDTFKDVIVKMADGNPGALRLCMDLMKDALGPIYLLHLDDMDIRGCAIWIGYKDYCKQDLERFKNLITERNPDMISFIKKEMEPYTGP